MEKVAILLCLFVASAADNEFKTLNGRVNRALLEIQQYKGTAYLQYCTFELCIISIQLSLIYVSLCFTIIIQ